MSNKGKFVNSTPFLKEAGVTTAIEGNSTEKCLRQDILLNVYMTYKFKTLIQFLFLFSREMKRLNTLKSSEKA